MNEAGLQLIRETTRLRLKAKLGPRGQFYIGYNHTGPDVTRDSRITEETAERLLLQDCAAIEREVQRLVRVPLNENQLSAVVCWLHAVTLKRARYSKTFEILTRDRFGPLEARLFQFAKSLLQPEWRTYRDEGGNRVDSPKMERRREAESRLFLTPVIIGGNGKVTVCQ